MRTPTEIAADLTALHQRANLMFVPPNLKAAAELSAEFAASVAATLETMAAAMVAAGLTPPTQATADQPAA